MTHYNTWWRAVAIPIDSGLCMFMSHNSWWGLVNHFSYRSGAPHCDITYMINVYGETKTNCKGNMTYNLSFWWGKINTTKMGILECFRSNICADFRYHGIYHPSSRPRHSHLAVCSKEKVSWMAHFGWNIRQWSAFYTWDTGNIHIYIHIYIYIYIYT